MRQLVAHEEYLLVTFVFRGPRSTEEFWRWASKRAGMRWERNRENNTRYQVAPWVLRPVDVELDQKTVTVRVKKDRLSWLRDKARALRGEIVVKSELVGT
jgi:hypothetical protein